MAKTYHHTLVALSFYPVSHTKYTGKLLWDHSQLQC